MDLQFKTFPFEVKASANDGSTFEGLVSVFCNIDSYGEIVDPGAFDQDLADFMANGFIGGLNHDWDNPIGTPQQGTAVNAKGLMLHASVIDTTHGMDVRKMLKSGVVRKLSIGYCTMGDMQLEDSDACMAYWEQKGYKPTAQDMARCQMGARVLTRIKLYEGSPVTVPANDLAVITAVKAAREAAISSLKTSEAVHAIHEDSETPRLVAIKAISTITGAEDFLRDAGGLSRSESKTYISQLKSLLREAVSDETPEEKGVPPVADTATEASETPAEDAAPEQKDAPETPPASIVTPAPEDVDDSPEAQEVRRLAGVVGDNIVRRFAQLDARIATSLAQRATRQ